MLAGMVTRHDFPLDSEIFEACASVSPNYIDLDLFEITVRSKRGALVKAAMERQMLAAVSLAKHLGITNAIQNGRQTNVDDVLVEAGRKLRESLRVRYAAAIAKANELLDAPVAERNAMTGSGDDYRPFFMGLALLECFDERLPEITAERARRAGRSKRLGYSPWGIEDDYGRSPNAKDVSFLAKLRMAFPEKPWRKS